MKQEYIDTIRKLHSEGYLDTEIAEVIPYSRKMIFEVRNKLLGLPANHVDLVRLDYARMDELLSRGYRIDKIAKELHCSDTSVRTRAREKGMHYDTKTRRWHQG